jgi:hypothetical protein
MKYIYVVTSLILISCMTPQQQLSNQMSSMMSQAVQMRQQMLGNVKDSEMALDLIDSTTLQKVFPVESNIADSMEKLPAWIIEEFSEDKDASVIINEEINSIEGTGSLLVSYEAASISQTMMLYFDYSVEVKEERIRLTLSKIHAYLVYVNNANQTVSEPSRTFLDEDKLRRISRGIKQKKTIENLVSHLNGFTQSDDDW